MNGIAKDVFRWEIEDAAANYAKGKVESEAFNVGGFKWITGFERVGDKPKIYLQCAMDHNGPWKCEVDVVVKEIGMNDGVAYDRGQGHFCFNESSCIQHYFLQDSKKMFFLRPSHMVDGKATFEVRINIISSERSEPDVDLDVFDAPNDMSNVILKIGEKRLHVFKELLSIHSPVFKTLFFGDYAEKGKEEVEIKDVVYEEFRDLLHLIYSTKEITDRNVQHILKLTDRFQMERMKNQAKKHLTQSKGIDAVTKLLLADQYRLTSLKEHCLQSFIRMSDLTDNILRSPGYEKISDNLKVAICDRMQKLSLQ